MALAILLNGAETRLEELVAGASLADVVRALGLRADRIAVEMDGAIVRRSAWDKAAVQAGTRLEIVHFVGGGAAA